MPLTAGEQFCNSNLITCSLNHVRFSKWGFCQRTSRFGSRPLDHDLNLNNPLTMPKLTPVEHFFGDSDYRTKEYFEDYSDLGAEYEDYNDNNVIKRNLRSGIEKDLDIVSIPQRFIAPQIDNDNLPIDSPLGPSPEPQLETKEPKLPTILTGSRGEVESRHGLPLFLLPPPVHLPPKVPLLPQEKTNHILQENIPTTDQPPFDEEDQIQVELDVTSKCPGGSLKECVFACVPLPDLQVYSLCVRECAERCPQIDS